MAPRAMVLARADQLGCVTQCAHGCIHVNIGHASWSFSEEQYMRFVTLLCDSAATFEAQRGDYGAADDAPPAQDSPQ
ncbi:MAG: hypothetical protein H6509_01625 [Bryobacterales bacterium]|nr:hypothetical protein [Bryobacterales bacterium]